MCFYEYIECLIKRKYHFLVFYSLKRLVRKRSTDSSTISAASGQKGQTSTTSGQSGTISRQILPVKR